VAGDQPFLTDLFGVPSPSPRVLAETRRPTPSRHIVGSALAQRKALELDASLVERLEATGRYRVLRKLEPRPVMPELWPPADRQPGSWPRLGIILDTETTGLDHATHDVIELGMVAFTYDQTGVRDVVGVFSALQEPSHAISAEITGITGITDEMVAGQRFDLDAIQRFIADADLLIAHNARFDRPFCEKLTPGFDVKPWACSVSEVDWVGLGFEGTKLGYLVGQCGAFHNGHRAVDDCHALLEVLSHPARTQAPSPFQQLLASSQQTRLRIHAIGSPFHTKDALKERGYRWSDGMGGKPKCWWREVAEDAYDDEVCFLEEEIYAGNMNAYVESLTACERFKA
jgi:DNA polymerase-3 subunit epsilon